MAQKISVYVDEELHKSLKAAASLRGMTLSEFMVGAARRALFGPSRHEASTKMDVVRESVGTSYSGDELRGMREEGRREWPK